jgi:hypothetical protein
MSRRPGRRHKSWSSPTRKLAAEQIRLVELPGGTPECATKCVGEEGRPRITARIRTQICQNSTIYPSLGVPRKGKLHPNAV